MACANVSNINSLLLEIQGFPGDSGKGLPTCIKRRRYLSDPLDPSIYICPVLEAMDAVSFRRKVNQNNEDCRFQNLVTALLNNRGSMEFDLKKVTMKEGEDVATFTLAEEYLETEGEFGLCDKRMDEFFGGHEFFEFKIQANIPYSEIRSINFSISQYWDNRPKKRKITFEFTQSTFAARIHLLILNLFKLSSNKAVSEYNYLTFDAEDDEQYIDMIQFIIRPLKIKDSAAINKFRDLFIEVLLGSENQGLKEKGNKLLKYIRL